MFSRALSRISLWLAIFAAALMTACGGGSDGNPNNPYDVMILSISETAVFPGQPLSLHVHGGHGPYYFESSSQSIIPVPAESDTDTVYTFARPVVDEGDVVIYVWDKMRGREGAASATVKVLPTGIYSSSVTVTATSGSGCTTSQSGDFTQICAGGQGIAEVQLQGYSVDNRQVQFRVIQGSYQIQGGTSAAWGNTVTATTDASGKARVAIQTQAGALTQVATIRVTETTTGNFFDASFMIIGADFKMTPTSAAWTTTEATCSASRTASFSLYGGTPPYTVQTTLGSLSTSTVTTSGGTVILTVATCGSGELTARDSAGAEVKATISYTATGTTDTTTNVVTTPIGSWGSGTTRISCAGGSTFGFTVSGGSGTYSAYALLNGSAIVSDPAVSMTGAVGQVKFTNPPVATGSNFMIYAIDDKGKESTTKPQIFCQ